MFEKKCLGTNFQSTKTWIIVGKSFKRTNVWQPNVWETFVWEQMSWEQKYKRQKGHANTAEKIKPGQYQELRLQLATCQRSGVLNKEAKKKIAREFLLPFFTHAQIDCFFRPEWVRHRNWSEQDFQTALTLRKLMSKKAFGYLRKKRLVPMPSLTSIRHYRLVFRSTNSTMFLVSSH